MSDDKQSEGGTQVAEAERASGSAAPPTPVADTGPGLTQPVEDRYRTLSDDAVAQILAATSPGRSGAGGNDKNHPDREEH